jgi:hypothetical protein
MKLLILIAVLHLAIYNNYYSQSFGVKSVNLETYQNISFNKINSNDDIAKAFHNSDRPKYGHSYGLGFSFFESEKISLTSTFSYTDIGYASEKFYVTFGDQIDPQTGFASNSGQINYIKYEYQFNYIDLNIGFNYYIINNKTKLYAHASPEFNYLINFNHISKSYDSNNKRISKDVDDRTESYKIAKTNISINGGIGMEFSLTQKAKLYTLLNYKQMLLSSAPESITEDKLYSYGLKIGLIYRLN